MKLREQTLRKLIRKELKSIMEGKSLDDLLKDANRIKKELADANREYSKSKTETNAAKVEAKKGQLLRVSNAIRNARANQVKNESVNENKNVGHYERVGNQTIVDSNFVNFSKGVLPNSELVHLGMGDFALKTPKGDITFERSGKLGNGIGADFVGRPHRITDDKGGKLVDELIKGMVKKKRAVLSMSESVNEDVWTSAQKKQVEKLDDEFRNLLAKKGIEPYSNTASKMWKSAGFQKNFQQIFQKDESVNEAKPAAIGNQMTNEGRRWDDFKDSKHGKILISKLGKSFSGSKTRIELYLDNLSKSMDDDKFLRILDRIMRDLGIDAKKYDNKPVYKSYEVIIKTLYKMYEDNELSESVNEANVVGKAVFDDGKGKLAFGYYKDDDEVTLVDYKTWKKLNFKDVSKGDTNKDRLVKAILRKQKQFNKKVEYNMWSKKTNPSFEEKMDWFIKNGWISNVTKQGIKESVVNETKGNPTSKVKRNGSWWRLTVDWPNGDISIKDYKSEKAAKGAEKEFHKLHKTGKIRDDYAFNHSGYLDFSPNDYKWSIAVKMPRAGMTRKEYFDSLSDAIKWGKKNIHNFDRDQVEAPIRK